MFPELSPSGEASDPKPKVTPRKGLPEFWVKGVAALLAGDNVCEYAVWFKARHQRYPKPPRDFDFKTWNIEHKALLDRKVEELLKEGYKPSAITLEDQNRFVLTGAVARLVGKPDIEGRHGSGKIRVWDAKTGNPKATDEVQVAIYVLSIPRAWKAPNLYVEGTVYYEDYAVHVTPEQAAPIWLKVSELLRRLGEGQAAPAPRPSPSECRFCDLAKSVCPARMEWTEETAVGAEVTEF